MLQKLQEKGYVKYERYKSAKLTDSGMKIACGLMKKHKIIADFLEIIGVERDLAEVDSCQLEHYVSTKTMKRIKKFVEFVSDAPHEPKWIEHFYHYVQTGERKKCNFYEVKE